jgi:phage/plasmid-like protein (TIGR03299 family)
MAHNLEKNEALGGATLVHSATGDTKHGRPWHKLGTQVPGELTVIQAHDIVMPWTVSKRGISVNATDTKPAIQWENAFAIVRDDTQKILNHSKLVTKRYEPFQNRQLADFLGTLFGTASAMIDTAGVIGNGERVWFLAKIPEVMKIRDLPDGTQDTVEEFFLATSSHDGTEATTLTFTSIRTVCENTLNAGLKGSKQSVSVRHTKGAQEAMQEAANLLGKSRTYWTKMREACQFLESMKVNTGEVEAFIKKLFPDRKNEETQETNTTAGVIAARERTRALFEAGMGNLGQSRWDLYNGLTQYLDHERPIRGETIRAEGSLFEEAGVQKIRQSAFDLLVAPGALTS